MSAATIASLRAAAEAQKASAERALRTLDEMEALPSVAEDVRWESSTVTTPGASSSGSTESSPTARSIGRHVS